MTKLNFAIAEIVDIYNFLPKVLAPKVVKVAVHPSQSNRDRPSLAEQKNGNYWIVLVEANYWLLPQSGLRINQFNLATVKSLFDCQGYELSEHGDFVLLEAAQVSGMPNGTEWRLEKKGVINFDPNYPADELRSQQKQAQQEIDRLQSELEETRKQNNRLNAQVAELAYNTLQKIRADLVTRDEFIKQGRRVETWEEKLNNTLNSLSETIYNQVYKDLSQKFSKKLKDIERKITQENRKINDKIAQLELEIHNRKTKDTKVQEQKEPTGITTLKPSEPPASQTYQSTAPSVSSSSHSPIEVSPTEESLANREMGGNDPIVLENKRRGLYEVYLDGNYHCLVPSQYFRISPHNYKSVEHLFDCQNYDPNYSDSYTVIRPAVVYPLAGGQTWQLQLRGILEF
ncbi:hypothetical protein MiHa_00516 [Microcystis aeruginosa NIES-2522]|uniref:hypothetical protein n=1 Tax=Microcystis aeruginosa TaxID=1126 RepID=UPI001253C475|nr:hypothetical protein [Microcystis aeruginosa]GCA82565.1 hypothetical protein MiHa_00516 [Microcystis aeruginosa NIES-2522]